MIYERSECSILIDMYSFNFNDVSRSKLFSYQTQNKREFVI